MEAPTNALVKEVGEEVKVRAKKRNMLISDDSYQRDGNFSVQ